MIELEYRVEIDFHNTTQTKIFSKKYSEEKVTKEELLRDFEYFIEEFIDNEQ